MPKGRLLPGGGLLFWRSRRDSRLAVPPSGARRILSRNRQTRVPGTSRL